MKDIIEVDYGIGSSYPDRIEINKHLPEDLKKEVLAHELKHTDKFSFKEMLSHSPELRPRFWLWMIKNPKSFYNFFPYRDGSLDVELCIGYTILVIVVGVSIWILTSY